jgi:hypothetical protein
MYRLAWAYNRLGVPDSALEWASLALEMEPGNSWYLCEVLRSLCSMDRHGEAAGYSSRIRGGGVCRYYVARAEMELETAGSPSLEWFRGAFLSPDDSTAADAACWLSLLLHDRVPADSVISLREKAVGLVPGDTFYRCLLSEALAEDGSPGKALEILAPLRLARETGQGYWQARAAVAKAMDDRATEIWALRRAWQARRTPDAASELGWILYLAGRDSMREGDLALARERLTEASGLGSPEEPFVSRADSILELIDEYTDQDHPAGG